MSINLECGCVNEIDVDSSVQRCLSKCEFHIKERESLSFGKQYYEDMMKAEPSTYIKELGDALGAHFDYLLGGEALEVGCGLSPYAEWLISLSYDYVGIDTRQYAIDWMIAQGHNAYLCSCEAIELFRDTYDLILAAHVLEHLRDAPEQLKLLVRHVTRDGHMIIIVPDDEDPCNPDHWWFFNEQTLLSCMMNAGLTDCRIAKRKIIERESFLYAIGRKA